LCFVKFVLHKENVTMKSKRFFQIFILLALLFSTIGSVRPVRANTDDPIIITHNLSFWEATFVGYVNASIYEKWQFEFNESHKFVVTVTPISGDLVPLLILLNANGNELARGTGSLTSTQSAGNYSMQIQPESGGGFYILTLREVIQNQGSASTVVNPTSVNVGETATVTVSLNNVPAEGYTSAEFTCTYDANLVEVSNILDAGLFGADAVTAINGPQNGSFIVAIAGSNGNKATTNGAAFTFSAKGLQAGQTAIECKARVSKGDNVLTDLTSTGASLTIVGSAPTATFTPTPAESSTPTSSTPFETPTSTPVESPTPVESATATSSTPVESPTSTPVESPTATFTSTPIESPTPTLTSTPVESPTPTPLPDGTLTGQVLASKPVTVSLYKADNSLAGSVTANADGTFSLTAPAGTYTVLATASGFLSAQGSVTLTGGSTSTMPTISLLAGDIDGNNVIDQFDAMTIGMSYNTAVPAAADLNNDGVINVLDLELLALNYRETGPVAWQ
jgi:hypothetical protein